MSSLAASSSFSFPPAPSLAHSLNSRGELGMFVNPYACSCATCVDYIAERAPEAPALAHEEPAPLMPCQSCRDRIREVSPETPEGCVPLCREGPQYSPLLCDSCRSACGDPYMAPELRSAASALSLGPSSEGAWAEPRSVAPSRPLLGRSLTLGLGGLGWGLGGGLTRSSSVTPSSAAIEGWGGEERPLFGADLLPAPSVALARTVTGLGYTPTVPEDDEDGDGAAAAASPYNGAVLPGLDPACPPAESALLLQLFDLRLSYKARQDAVYSEEHRSHDEMAAADAEWDDLDRKIDAIEGVLRSFGVILRSP